MGRKLIQRGEVRQVPTEHPGLADRLPVITVPRLGQIGLCTAVGRPHPGAEVPEKATAQVVVHILTPSPLLAVGQALAILGERPSSSWQGSSETLRKRHGRQVVAAQIERLSGYVHRKPDGVVVSMSIAAHELQIGFEPEPVRGMPIQIPRQIGRHRTPIRRTGVIPERQTLFNPLSEVSAKVPEVNTPAGLNVKLVPGAGWML